MPNEIYLFDLAELRSDLKTLASKWLEKHQDAIRPQTRRVRRREPITVDTLVEMWIRHHLRRQLYLLLEWEYVDSLISPTRLYPFLYADDYLTRQLYCMVGHYGQQIAREDFCRVAIDGRDMKLVFSQLR